MKPFAKLRAVWVLFELLLTVPVVIIMMRLFPKKQWSLRKKWARLQSLLMGYRLQIVGEADPDAKLVLMNHQSLLDIIVVDASYPKNLSWVAKKEIAKIPFFGQILTVPKMIIVDRESKKSLLKLLKDAQKRIDEGRVIAMFPEGTRGDGKRLLPFRSGARFLAEKLHLKVQPIVIVNTRTILDSVNFSAHGGSVKIIYLDAIDPDSDNAWYDKLHQQMQNVLEKETKQT
ncbi:MAG TPA: 1-acyl-sn-glycerol-3-phosphate acyltransferase [Campylobacteraceae bacterium]|nr:1-acyl-sn-glycerol-3-phosphate acyltransferase [Campylobacteraceae bacterium]